ncbi:unnamed protein product [Moneuplotes crassus]|uniref:Uncharacterized protein n=1 Tax=Euplotes crassus TaxID=5936 RepID=A0AAD1TZB4_EUPCR|nr:unnamed protein product [Moneuplotes crassus]
MDQSNAPHPGKPEEEKQDRDSNGSQNQEITEEENKVQIRNQIRTKMLNFSLDEQEIVDSPKDLAREGPNYLFTKIGAPEDSDDSNDSHVKLLKNINNPPANPSLMLNNGFQPVFMHKAPEGRNEEVKKEDTGIVNIKSPKIRDQVIEIDDFDLFSPEKGDQEEHEQTDFIEKINKGMQEENSMESILGRIPKEYFREEKRYQSIDRVLEHIDHKREDFIKSINNSPNIGAVSKTIEPILNSISPQAKNALKKLSARDSGPVKHQVSVSIKSKLNASLKNQKEEKLRELPKTGDNIDDLKVVHKNIFKSTNEEDDPIQEENHQNHEETSQFAGELVGNHEQSCEKEEDKQDQFQISPPVYQPRPDIIENVDINLSPSEKKQVAEEDKTAQKEEDKHSKVADSERKDPPLKSALKSSLQVTFRNEMNEPSLNEAPHDEQGAGTLISNEPEIINFETNDNPEFKEAKKLSNSKNSRNKKKGLKSKKSKSKASARLEKSLKSKKKEIDQIPLGEGIDTTLLDFENMSQIPLSKKKDLKLTDEDQRYFSGAKHNPFLPRKPPQASLDRFSSQAPTTEDPLTKKIEEYFGLRAKRKKRLENKRKMLEMKQQKNEQRVAKMLEQNIIDDIGVNFLFRRGTGLKEGLIDIDRAFRIIDKVDGIIKDSQNKIERRKEQGIKKQEMDEEKMYNFDFVKFFEKSDLDAQSEPSDHSFMTTSSVPRKPHCLLEEEKWNKVMKFLRANPNILLKLVPTTIAVDEQGVEDLQKQSIRMNKDLDGVKRSLRIKSASRKKRLNKKNKLDKAEPPIINKSQILASSKNQPISRKGTGIDETFYSENRSVMNKSSAPNSKVRNDSLSFISKRLSNYQKLGDQLPGINIPQYFMGASALSKVDSVYSSNNVPVIKDLKVGRIRPMSMKNPRKLRQKIDEKYYKNPDLQNINDQSMPTVWNSNNPNNFVQVPFRNFGGIDSSFTSTNMIKSPDYNSNHPDRINEDLNERIEANSPNALMDLSQPVLTLRNQTKDSVQKEFLLKAKKLKCSSKGVRGSTMISTTNPSASNLHALRKRVKTREDVRPRNRNNIKDMTISAPNKRNLGSRSKSPSEVRSVGRTKNLRIHKKKKSKISLGFKKAQESQIDDSIQKSKDEISSLSRNSPKQSLIQKNSTSQIKHYTDNLSPPDTSYIQIDEPQNPSPGSPSANETTGIFNVNIQPSFKSSMSHFSEVGSQYHKVKIIDWEETKFFQSVLDDCTELNTENSNRFFKYEEVDYIVDMMKKRYKDFKSTEMLTPFYKKGQNTLEMLMQAFELDQLYEKIQSNYSQVTLENCFKILIRCKMCFEARESLKIILRDIAAHEILMAEVFDKIENHLESSTDEEERDELRRKGETLSFYAQNIVSGIRNFQRDHKMFGTTFVFANRKIDINIRREIGELRKLLELYELYIAETNPKEMVERPDIRRYRTIPRRKKYYPPHK